MRAMRIAGGCGKWVVVIIESAIVPRRSDEIDADDIVYVPIMVIIYMVEIRERVLPIVVYILTGIDPDIRIEIFVCPLHPGINDRNHHT